MRKLFKLCLAGFMCLISICGCHGKSSMAGFTVPETFDESRQYEISFWAKNDTNKTQVAIYKNAISEFEKMYPNIKVNMKLYTDYGKIYNDVITNISTNTTPNICVTYPDHIATYMTGANTVVPLDDLFENEKYGLGGSELKFDGPSKKEIVPEFLDECILSDNHYAVPFMRSTEALYINKTYVEQLGFQIPDIVTWDWIWQVSEAATAKNPDGTFALNGQKVLLPFIYKSTDNMMIQMLKQKNAGYSSDAGEVQIFNDTTEQILFDVAKHASTGAFTTFKISGYPANFLNAGQCVFAVDSTAGATWMGTDAPLCDIPADKIVPFETAIRPIPQYDASNPQMISQGPSICLFNKSDPQEVLASWMFVQYLISNDVQIPYAQTEGYVPVTEKAQKDVAYQDYLAQAGADNNEHYIIKIEASKLLMENTENTFVTPVFNGSTSLRDAAGSMIETATKAARGGKTVDSAYVHKIYDNVTSLYHLDSMQSTAGSDASAKDLGPLPSTSKILLGTLVAVWILLGIYAYREYKQKKSSASN